jgi:hypothetical protein
MPKNRMEKNRIAVFYFCKANFDLLPFKVCSKPFFMTSVRKNHGNNIFFVKNEAESIEAGIYKSSQTYPAVSGVSVTGALCVRNLFFKRVL